MKKLIILTAIIFVTACAKKVEKPFLTLGQYADQVTKIKAVMSKLQTEKDVKVMNFMADGVETTRAIPCDAIAEECNAYYEYLNKVVFLTRDGDLTEDDKKIIESYYKRAIIELAKSEKIIQTQWKDYINQQEKEASK